MAGISVNGRDILDKLLKGLEDTARDTDTIAKACVDEAAPVMESAYRTALASVEYGPMSTGSAAASVSLYGTKKNEMGVYNVARPVGTDDKGVRNAQKAALLEYGTSTLPARPWADKAKNMAEGTCTQIVERRFEHEIKKRTQ